jgi:hypothetical protein
MQQGTGCLMGAINDARLRLVTTLTNAGITVVSDSRNIRPGVVGIDPPEISRSTTNQLELSFPVNVVMPPPGNLDSLIPLLDLMDLVISATSATSATPTVYSAGGQELPAYTVTVPWVAYP